MGFLYVDWVFWMNLLLLCFFLQFVGFTLFHVQKSQAIMGDGVEALFCVD
jgi:hypothetical protein